MALGLSISLPVSLFVTSSCTGADPAVVNPGDADGSSPGIGSSGADANGSSGEAGPDAPPVDCGPVDPTTLIVDGVTGNDVNPGTAKCPLQTVSAALAHVNAVSTVTTVQVDGVAGNPLVYANDKFPLSPQKALTLKGRDGDKVVLRGSGPCGATPCTVNVEVAKVTLANLTIENPEATGDGISATAAGTTLALQKVTATNCGGAGVRLAGTTGVTLDTVTLTTNGRGLVIDTGATATATSTTITLNQNEGALVTNGGLTSTSCTFSQNKLGVSVGKESRWASTKDFITANTTHGATSVACKSNPDTTVFATESTFSTNSGDGLQMLGCDELIAQKSSFLSNGGSGLVLGASAIVSLGDGQSGNDGANVFQSLQEPNQGAGICNQTVQRSPAITFTACFDVWSQSTPTTSAACTGQVDIGHTTPSPIPIATSGGQCM